MHVFDFVGTLVFHQCLGVGLGAHAISCAFTVLIPGHSHVTVSSVIMKTISSTEISHIDAEIASVIVRIASGRKRIVINMRIIKRVVIKMRIIKRIVINMRIIKWIFLNWINRIQKYPAGLLLAYGPLNEDEKMTISSLSDRLSSGQGLSQVTQSQSPYSVGQLPDPILLSQLTLRCFQRVFPAAMERAIKEVMSPVVQRSVANAIQTTKELVLKMTHNGPMESNSTGAAMDIYHTLSTDLDTVGRYVYLNAIANQLCYSNNHTYFFSYVLLYLFVEANQEQITRVLLSSSVGSNNLH